MFKKFKDKLAEEMKQSPARLQASMQQLAQAVVSPALSNSSIQELSTSNDNFSLTEEGDETPKNSPARHGFQNVDLMSPASNSMGISRRSSVSSITSDNSSLFPIYESPANLYHLQSDMDQSASELDENISPQLDRVTKDQLYSAYRKVQTKYHKYRGRYTDLAAHYRELERAKGKLESVLVETQDKVLRRIADLKEQCQLEQQAKAHLEEALRNDIEEKDHMINTLNTKIKLLQTSGPSFESAVLETSDQKQNSKDNLIDLSTESPGNCDDNMSPAEKTQLKEKLKKLENLILKYKDSLKRNKEKFTELMEEKNTLESTYETMKSSNEEKFGKLEAELTGAHAEIRNLTDQVHGLKKREEESVISLAENKLSIHRELEDKEEQIKQLQRDLKFMTESKDSLSETIEKYKGEVEKLKLLHSSQSLDADKKEVIQDISRGKSEALKLMQQEMEQKLIDMEGKMDKKEEGISEKIAQSSESLTAEIEEMKNRYEDLQKLSEEYRCDRDKLHNELSNCKLKCQQLKSEQDAQKIVLEEKKKEADLKIEKLQATVQSLDKELENMRGALMDRDKVCESFNVKVHEYATLLEKSKEKLLKQDAELKSLREVVQDNTEISKLQDELENKTTELLGLHSELKSCRSTISDFREKFKESSSKIDSLCKEKHSLIANILNCNNSIRKLKEDCAFIKNNVSEYVSEQSRQMLVFDETIATSLTRLAEADSVRNTEAENLHIKVKDFEELKSKHFDLERELAEAVRVKTILESDFNKCKEQLNDVSIKLQQKNEVESKNCKLIAEIDNLHFKLHDLEKLPDQIEILRDECSSLKKKLDDVTSMNTSFSNEITELNAQLKDSRSIVDELGEVKEKYAEATETITLLMSESSKYDLAEQEAQTLRNEIRTLKDESLRKDDEIIMFSDRLQTEERLIETLKIDCENQKKSIEEIHLENKYLKDKQNELLKRNEEFCESNEVLKQKIVNYEKNNKELLDGNANLREEIKSLRDQLEVTSTEFHSKNTKLNSLIDELALRKNEEEQLLNEISVLKSALNDSKSVEERNKQLLANLAALEEKLFNSKATEEENSKLKLELSDLNEKIINLEKVQLQNSELITEQTSLRNRVIELEDVNSNHGKLQSYVNNLESRISSLEQVESRNIELETELSTLKAAKDSENTKLMSRIENINGDNERLAAELDEMKNAIDEKVAELKLLDTRNSDLLKEIERLKCSSSIIESELREAEALKATIKTSEETITKLKLEVETFKETNATLQEEIKTAYSGKSTDESLLEKAEKLREEKEKLEAQLDEALITFQAKESQMQIVNEELKTQADKLREDLSTNEEEQSMRLKQLVKEFQAQLHDKEEELQAALEKRFDRQQNYESNLIQQYKEQLKDFQIELTAKSEQIENLILENKEMLAQKDQNIDQLTDKIALIKKEHADSTKELEKKWKSIVQQKTSTLETKHEEEITELTKEWRNERKPHTNAETSFEELESTSRVAMAAVQSNTGSFHTLQQTLTAQRRELAELRKIVKLRHDTLEDSTEIEYLRNILYEYMMGRETMVLARVIAAVVKFDQEQTSKILKKEEDKMTLLGSLGLT